MTDDLKRPPLQEDPRLTVRCPYCESPPLIWCTTDSGSWAQNIHAERRHLLGKSQRREVAIETEPQDENTSEELITLEEWAAKNGVSEETAQGWAEEGKLQGASRSWMRGSGTSEDLADFLKTIRDGDFIVVAYPTGALYEGHATVSEPGTVFIDPYVTIATNAVPDSPFAFITHEPSPDWATSILVADRGKGQAGAEHLSLWFRNLKTKEFVSAAGWTLSPWELETKFGPITPVLDSQGRHIADSG